MPGVLKGAQGLGCLCSPPPPRKAEPPTPSHRPGWKVCSPQDTLLGFGAKELLGKFKAKQPANSSKPISATKDRGEKKAQASRWPVKQLPGLPEKQLEPHSLSDLAQNPSQALKQIPLVSLRLSSEGRGAQSQESGDYALDSLFDLEHVLIVLCAPQFPHLYNGAKGTQ